MLNFPPAVRIWLGTAPVDLRRSFDGLAEQVRQHLHNDPLSGHIFCPGERNSKGRRRGPQARQGGPNGYEFQRGSDN